MNERLLKIAIVINVMPIYREGFYDILFEKKDVEITVYAQKYIPGRNLRTIHERYQNHVKLVNFICAKREKIGLQFLPFYKLLTKYDVVVVEGNPRQVSHFLLATLLRLLRKNVVLWTMAHSHRGFKPTENLRLFWSRIFNYLFVYTDYEVEFLRTKGFKNQIIVGMNNGLNQRKIDAAIEIWNSDKLMEWRNINGLKDKVLLLSCARLDTKNRFELLIDALPIIVTKHPNLIWCVIGSGLEEEKLHDLVKVKNLTSNVRFIGEEYEETKLAPWFLSSEIFIHPGAIGLSILHAFGYGLPLITNGAKSLQCPEYVVFKNGFTGLNFIENDINDLASVILQLLGDDEMRNRMKICTRKIAQESYNVDVMAERFFQIVNKAASIKI